MSSLIIHAAISRIDKRAADRSHIVKQMNTASAQVFVALNVGNAFNGKGRSRQHHVLSNRLYPVRKSLIGVSQMI
ncbi:hypothetical protein D3C81_2036350 [compost metagenome]